MPALVRYQQIFLKNLKICPRTDISLGINLAFAKALYNEGCCVLIVDVALHRDAVAWIESIQGSKSKAKVIFHKSDVSKWAELDEAFDVFAHTFGGVPYIVCPGAGIYEPVRGGPINF